MAKEILQKSESLYEEFFRKPGANPYSTHYCPGCGHGVVHKLIAEAMDDFGIRERTIFVNPVGCSVFGYYYFNCGNVQVAHGRAPAVATGIKRALPHSVVISYQGDGDLAAIGANNILQAANRGEHITVIFVNNAIYGMTGSQMAPTTLIGQKTTTTPWGRTAENEGYPMRMSELLATLEAPVYIERVAITDAKHVMQARKAIRKALQNQIDGRGFSFVEVLSACPTGWKMDPIDAKNWVAEVMTDYFKLNILKDKNGALKKVEIPTDSKPKPKKEEPTKEEILALLGENKESAQVFEKPDVDENYQNPRIKIAGFGGQGILLLGQLLAESAMLTDYHTTWLPSYGPEMRGGTANCHVIISDKRIGSPLVAESDMLIAMNLPSLDKFEDDVRSNGVIFVNRSLIDREVKRQDVEAVYVPATELADELGETKVANMVMVGAYLGYTGLLSMDSVLSAAQTVIKRKEFMELNEKALRRGMEFVKKEYAKRSQNMEELVS
ncbi:2-ketoisovalerate ferredoxin oxidoreductase [candidate division KSB1 bacterium]|nr:2-ketoisovalerate ferredoxin oxidoreductase [candidate division KSB1 bacterium]NIR72782.1 2-ketoisovalerate ferredoxin oxidoreductase [candidate division KSB1 bacterium]NIS23738.1 2-ketoisovalerate ferredoxin oxidoreductase [candidate division KSB1 bacterium]NIT70659.1 2-ketoisovalerate ferredoxin oxidoreductase [candidate division KSB1 bacterium]NIU24386.1 2-ketoisovalerate ferredoxin oxidoreductase [candidate division KSB1 bacterium]